MRIKVLCKLRYILPCTSASSVHVSRDAHNGERACAGGTITGAGETAARAGAMVMAGEHAVALAVVGVGGVGAVV